MEGRGKLKSRFRLCTWTVWEKGVVVLLHSQNSLVEAVHWILHSVSLIELNRMCIGVYYKVAFDIWHMECWDSCPNVPVSLIQSIGCYLGFEAFCLYTKVGNLEHWCSTSDIPWAGSLWLLWNWIWIWWISDKCWMKFWLASWVWPLFFSCHRMLLCTNSALLCAASMCGNG